MKKYFINTFIISSVLLFSACSKTQTNVEINDLKTL